MEDRGSGLIAGPSRRRYRWCQRGRSGHLQGVGERLRQQDGTRLNAEALQLLQARNRLVRDAIRRTACAGAVWSEGVNAAVVLPVDVGCDALVEQAVRAQRKGGGERVATALELLADAVVALQACTPSSSLAIGMHGS